MKSVFFNFFIAIAFLFSTAAMSMDDGALEMLKSMKIDKTQISSMLDNLEKMGRITPEQARKAKDELNSLNDSELKKYQDIAIKKVASGDAERIMKHDFTQSTPKLDASVVELPQGSSPSAVSNRAPASASPQPIVEEEPAKIDFTKLGQ